MRGCPGVCSVNPEHSPQRCYRTAERTISLMRASVVSSRSSRYHAAGERRPSGPPAGSNAAFSVTLRFISSSLRKEISAGVLADLA